MNFELTSIAYRFYSNKTLKKRRFFLKIMRINAFISLGKFFLSAFSVINLPVNWLFRKTIFPLFCGGENLEASLESVNILGKQNILSVLDYSVEGLNNEESFNSTAREIMRSIAIASENLNIPFAVFKPTALAGSEVLSGNVSDQSNEYLSFKKRIYEIAQFAYNQNVKLMIDAEDFVYQDIVDKEVENLMTEFNKEKTIVYTTIQMYRKDRPAYLNKLIEKARNNNFFVGIKLVRGAYLEKENLLAKKNNYETPICESKDETDRGYNNALKTIINNIDICELFAGTHNEESCKLLADTIIETGLLKNDKRVYFAQLFGMADNISVILANEGFNVVKYVPYGPVKEVIPYLLRRAEENSSVSEQSKREIYLINKELKNRKHDN
jgi:proline dehydrogenase